jgi:O-methyltransferase involved in polyketide biosynthesis
MLKNLSHDKISPTAKLVAYWRRFSDIPFSKDIADLFEVEKAVEAIFNTQASSTFDDLLVPLVEIRYKCLQNIILESKAQQVLEFASGISLRGLAMTIKDPQLTYIETDLADLNSEKLTLVQKIMQRNNLIKPNNLFFEPVNILHKKDIASVLNKFNLDKPIIIINEGLFQYLNHDEKREAALNIKPILKRSGGMWVTPDFDSKQEHLGRDIDKEHFAPIMNAITKSTGRSFLENSFESEAAIFSFFEELGFRVEKREQFNKNIMLSTYKDRTMSPEIQDLLKSLKLWVLRV